MSDVNMLQATTVSPFRLNPQTFCNPVALNFQEESVLTRDLPLHLAPHPETGQK